MGNSIGIDCSDEYIYITNIFYKRNQNNQNENNKNYINETNINNNYINNNFYKNEDYLNYDNHNIIKKNIFINDDYIKCINKFIEYIIKINFLIKDSMFLYIINKKENYIEKKLSIKHIQKICNGNDENKKFLKLHKYLTCQNIKQNKLENENVLFDIYFLKLKLNVIKKVLTLGKNYINNIRLNITGYNNDYIKKIIKINKENIYHDEINCINMSFNFYKLFCPNLIFTIKNNINEKCKNNLNESNVNKKYENIVNEKYENNVNEKNDKNNLYFKIKLNKEQLKEIYPIIIINLNSPIEYYIIDIKQNIYTIGSNIISIQTIKNLWTLLTKKFTSINYILKLSKKGNNEKFNLTIGDIYGTSYKNIGLDSKVIASLFGKNQINCKLKNNNIFINNDNFNEKKKIIKESLCNDNSNNILNENKKYKKKKKRNLKFNKKLTKNSKKHLKKKAFYNEYNFYSDFYCNYDEITMFNNENSLEKKNIDFKNFDKNMTDYDNIEINKSLKYLKIKKKKQKEKFKKIINKTKTEKKEIKNSNKNLKKKIYNKKCNLAKSLISMFIMNLSQQIYFYSKIYNVDNIVFLGHLLDNNYFLLTLQQLINYWSNKKKKNIYVINNSDFLNSLGVALI